MIKVKSGTEPTEELVTKIITRFLQTSVPRFKKLEQYYQVENPILQRTLDPSKPNNRMAHGFAKFITNMATGYFMGEGVRLEADDKEYKDALSNVLEQNANSDTDYETAKEMSKKGKAFELLYLNEQSEIRFKRFSAEEVIPVYSTSVSEFLEFAIRIWSEEDLITSKITQYAEVYTKTEIIEYKKERHKYKETDRRPHHFDDVPVLVYWNNEERKGDYEDVLSLIDAYDKSQSDTANDFEYFTDAFLVLIGAGGGLVKEDGESEENDEIKTLKQERVLLLDENGQAQWLIKNINDTAVENFKNRVYDDIFFLAQVPALTDESFAGNLSGVALRYKLIGLEQLAATKEKKFLTAYRKKIRLITRLLNVKLNRKFDPSKVTIKFDRNMTDNLLELATIVSMLERVVSKETLLQLLPFIKDVQAELKRRFEEMKKEDGLGMLDEDMVSRLGEG